MYTQNGKRFRMSLLGYNRTAVDAEFARLLNDADNFSRQQDELRAKVDALTNEKDSMSRERSSLSSTVTQMSTHVLELENNLQSTRSENEGLQRTIDAQKAENNALQLRFDQLRVRDRDFSLREREFKELQDSVSSIMSVTKRATDRLFQKAVDNQERVAAVARDAAVEIAAVRRDVSDVREQLNYTLDELQDKIDRVDASLTGAVHKLIAIKHDDALRAGENQSDIQSEVERLLSMRAGEVDYSGGKGYTVPVLGPHSAKFLSDTASRVNERRAQPPAQPVADADAERVVVEARKAVSSPFESTQDSIIEANNLLEGGYVPPEPEPEPEPETGPIPIGFNSQPEPIVLPESAPIAMPASYPSASLSTDASGSGYTMGHASFIPAEPEPEPEPVDDEPEEEPQQRVHRVHVGPYKVNLVARKKKNRR